MKNFGEMADATLAYLRSYVRDQEASTHLTADLTPVAKELSVNDAAVLTRGRIQIEDELIWIDTADRGNATGVIPPYGRGMDGTVAAQHVAGTRVIVQPLYPRKVVKDSLNQAISMVGVQLYGVETLTIPGDPTKIAYDLPDYTRDVLSVKASDRRASILDTDVAWLRDWVFDPQPPVGVSATGKAVYLYDGSIPHTFDLTVTISRDPVALFFDTQIFTECYLPVSVADVVVLYAASRLMASADAYNITGRSVEANTLDSKVQPGKAADQSKYLYQLAEARLEQERVRLLNRTVQRSHYARWGSTMRHFSNTAVESETTLLLTISGTSVTAVAPLPITTTRFPA